jgi:hypothetical protein
LQATRGLVPALSPSGRLVRRAGLSVFDERACLEGFRAIGVELARLWDSPAFAERRNADIAAWVAHRRAAGGHPDELPFIRRHLRELSLPA